MLIDSKHNGLNFNSVVLGIYLWHVPECSLAITRYIILDNKTVILNRYKLCACQAAPCIACLESNFFLNYYKSSVIDGCFKVQAQVISWGHSKLND